MFLFLLARAAPAHLRTPHFVALRSHFLFSRPSVLKFSRSSLRHSARSLLVSAAPTSQPFLLFSSYLTPALSSPLYPLHHFSFYLNLSGRNCLLYPRVLSGYNGSPGTRFFRGTTRLMIWPDGERYLRRLQSTHIFSRTGGVLCYLNCLTHRFPQFSPKNLCSLITLVVFFLVFAATDIAFC